MRDRRNRRPLGRLGRGIALAVGTAVAAGGLGAPGAAASTQSPGVTPTQIDVGAISTLSGPIAANFESMVPGVKAYFDMINAQGGVHGRKIVLTHSLDDGGNPSQFSQLAHTLIDQDHVFAAVGIATAFFSPGYFATTNTPTYGYDVTENWAGPDNLFAAGGSVVFLPSTSEAPGYLAHRLKAKSIAVVAYGISASSDACTAAANGLRARGFHVGYTNLNVSYPGSGISSDVQRMQQAGSDLVISCMDVTGNIAMARAIEQYGLKTHQLWFNGDDQATLRKYPSLMKGVYFTVFHVPFDAPLKHYPALASYLRAMKKYEPKYVYDEVAVQGWESAALFVAGVRAAGSDLTQHNVIAQTNKLTAFTAYGLTAPVNWAKSGHTGHTYPDCTAFIQARGDKFVSVFGPGHQVFLCFDNSPKIPEPVTPPPGTPGT